MVAFRYFGQQQVQGSVRLGEQVACDLIVIAQLTVALEEADLD